MWLFLFPLISGFIFNSLSAFTALFSRWWGERQGRVITAILRNILGIPVWVSGLAMAMRSHSPVVFITGLVTDGLAWCLLLAGSGIILWGLWAIRQRAAVPSIEDTLVTHGLYAHVRHPLYSGMFFQLIGVFTMSASLTALIACILGIFWIQAQARLEEIDLVQRLPGYSEYMQRVPRFIPRLHLTLQIIKNR
jgi:protein-S-isoprenylcysteine O-methyltransferase Ste14